MKQKKSVVWKKYLSDNAHFADLINGIVFGGEQVVQPTDLEEKDVADEERERDILRKVGLGVGFAIVGIEHQELVDYKMPVRIMDYETADYKKQLSEIEKEVRQHAKGLSAGEYLYGFRKRDKLQPVITIVLYVGEEPWDAATHLQEILDLDGIPESVRQRISDYQINVVDVRCLKDTSVFKTDVRKVFEYLRCWDDGVALMNLINSDSYYRNLEKDAFDVISAYAKPEEKIRLKTYIREGGIDMRSGISEIYEIGVNEGRAEGRNEGENRLVSNFLTNGGTEEEAIRMLGVTKEDVERARRAMEAEE